MVVRYTLSSQRGSTLVNLLELLFECAPLQLPAEAPHGKTTERDSTTGHSRTVNTDSAGVYSLQDLPISQYTVKASAHR
jgi:hypothetical protein